MSEPTITKNRRGSNFFRPSHNGAVLYEGDSLLHKSYPVKIVAILTGFTAPSANRKLGDILQCWILNANTQPHLIRKTKEDEATCGDCPASPHRHNFCYVRQDMMGSIYAAYAANRYPMFSQNHLEWISRMKIPLRLTGFGEATAVPFEVFSEVITKSAFTLGYTRNWSLPDIDLRWQKHLMASCFSLKEKRAANLKGWRTFRCIPSETTPLDTDEILCRNYSEKLTCVNCQLCQGRAIDESINIADVVHGSTYVLSNYHRNYQKIKL